jgi:hypothetical protein
MNTNGKNNNLAMHFLRALFAISQFCTKAGLPDGIFSNQNTKFGYI